MNSIDNTAKDIAESVKAKLDSKGFVISTIVVISAMVSIIYNLVKLSKLCKYSSGEALGHMREPNIVDKIKIRRAIRKSLKEQDVKLPKGEVGNFAVVAIEEEISKAAARLTAEDVSVFIEIVKLVEKDGGFPK